MGFSLFEITGFGRLLGIESELNDFVRNHSDNPFLLCGFVREFMELNLLRGWRPLVLVAFEDGKIVGLVPFAFRRRFNAVNVKFLFGLHYSPDFVVDEAYRETFLEHVVSFLFENLICQFVDLVLPLESSNFEFLKRNCEANGVYFRAYPTVKCGHCVLPVRGSWSDFEKLRGSDFRRRFRRMERKMKEAGGYEVYSVDRVEDSVFEDVLYIERRSWKEKWRRQRKAVADLELFKIWEGVKRVCGKVPNFKWKVWFLKVNGELASYALTLQFKNVGYIVKTSFNEKFRGFYPGIYIANVAVKDFFEGAVVEKIDYQTNLPFMETWRPMVYPRVRAMMGRKSFYRFIIFLSSNRGFCTFRDQVLGPFVSNMPFAFAGG
jgi:hypothetical protein